jgi:hypothetical protein
MNEEKQEEKILKMMTGLLINYSVYLTKEKGIEIKYQDIQNFQNWLINLKTKNDGQKSL